MIDQGFYDLQNYNISVHWIVHSFGENIFFLKNKIQDS